MHRALEVEKRLRGSPKLGVNHLRGVVQRYRLLGPFFPFYILHSCPISDIEPIQLFIFLLCDLPPCKHPGVHGHPPIPPLIS